MLAMYSQLPSYKAMFEREGLNEPGEVALVGSAAEVEDSLEGLALAGVTDYAATIFGTSKDEYSATREVLMNFMK